LRNLAIFSFRFSDGGWRELKQISGFSQPSVLVFRHGKHYTGKYILDIDTKVGQHVLYERKSA